MANPVKTIFSGLLGLAMLATGCMTTNSLWAVKKHSPASNPRPVQSSLATNILVHYDEHVSGLGWQFTLKEPAIQHRAYWLFPSVKAAISAPPAFVEATNTAEWEAVPMADLNCFITTNDSQAISFDEAVAKLEWSITNRADLAWLKRDTKKHPNFIRAGVNRLGEPLFVTNSLPANGYYWKLSASPPRYLFNTNTPPSHGYYAACLGNQFTVWLEGKESGTFTLPTYRTHGQSTNWRVALTPVAALTDVATDCAIVCAIAVVVCPPVLLIGGK